MDDGQPRPLWPALPGNHRFREDHPHVRDVRTLQAVRLAGDYTTAYDLHTQFKHQLEKEASRYEEFLRAKYLFLDELGSEPERCQSYGTDYTPVQNLISYRYDRKLPTIVPTNLADDKILDRYGPRMMDRINEMFSILRFKGDSYRK